MAFPDGVQTVTLTAGASGYRTLDGDPYQGAIRFTPSVSRVVSAEHGVIALGSVNATLGASGQFTVDPDLLAVDAEGFDPPFTYRVDEEFTNAPSRSYSILLPAAVPEVALPSLIEVEASDGTTVWMTSSAGGDLSGRYPNPTVARINGVAVTGTPTVGQVPTATSATAATWQTPAGGGGGSGTPSDTVTAETSYGQSAAAGAGTAYARGDHTHGTPAAPTVGTTAGTYAAGNDARITGAAQKSANLSDLASPSTARTNLGLGTAATQATGAFDPAGAAAAAQAAAATDATTKANAAQAAAISTAAGDATTKANAAQAAATAAAEADAATRYLPLDGGGTVEGTVTVADGNLIVDSSGTAINAVDRGATTNYAAYGWWTGGVERWGLQMQPGSQDLHLVDSANGLPVLRVQPGAGGPNVALLDGGTDFGDGVGVLHVPNAATLPSSNPTSGAIVYAEGGILKARSASGAIGSLLPVGTAAATVAAGNDTRFPQARPWLFDVTASTYGAVGDAKVVGDAAMGSGAAILTSATASFQASDVGKAISVKGAGASGVTTLITTIASRQSTTQVTLSTTNASGGAISGAVAIWGTDDTAAIQAAVDAAEAYLATHTYAQVYFPPRPYIVAGALSSAKSGNGQITFGVYSTAGVKRMLEFRGEGDGAAAVRHWDQTVPQYAGSCLISLGVYASTSAQTTDLNANGNPGVISGPNEGTSNGLAYGAAARFSNIIPALKNLTILTTHSALGLTYGAANLWGCANAHVENFGYGTTGTVASPSTDYSSPGTFGAGLSVGLLLPAPGNNDNVIAKNVSCGGGYTYAMFLTEHAVVDRYMALYCWAGLCAVGSYAGSVGSVHAMKVLSASIEACTNELYIVGVGSSGVGPIIDIDQLSTENSTPNIAGNSAGAMAGALGRVKLTGLFTEAGVSVSNPTGIELVNGQVPAAIKRKTTTFTCSPIDRVLICDTAAGGFTGTLPAADFNPVEYVFKTVGANTLTVGTTSSQLIYTTSGTGATTATVATGNTLRVQAMYNGTTWGWYAI